MIRNGEWHGTTWLDAHARRRENDGGDVVVARSGRVLCSGEERGRETALRHGAAASRQVELHAAPMNGRRAAVMLRLGTAGVQDKGRRRPDAARQQGQAKADISSAQLSA